MHSVTVSRIGHGPHRQCRKLICHRGARQQACGHGYSEMNDKQCSLPRWSMQLSLCKNASGFQCNTAHTAQRMETWTRRMKTICPSLPSRTRPESIGERGGKRKF